MDGSSTRVRGSNGTRDDLQPMPRSGFTISPADIPTASSAFGASPRLRRHGNSGAILRGSAWPSSPQIEHADRQGHQAGNDDREPDGARDRSPLLSGEEA